MAARYLVGERSTVSLQATVLINEVCVRLLGWDPSAGRIAGTSSASRPG